MAPGCRRSAVLLPLLVMLLAASALPLAWGQQLAGDSHQDKEELPCEGFRNATTAAGKCAYIRKHCEEEGLWAPLKTYYCNAVPSGLGAALLVASVMWLLILFQALGATADNFFSPILTQLSQDLGLPPRFAGVTFLALGNGAPDLSSTILAITSGDYNLSLGALTGGGMFVSTCVAGACILTADGAKCRGALVRDVLGYACTILTILLFLVDGYVSYYEVCALFVIYAVFMFSVLGADLWHRLVHLKRNPEAPTRAGGDMELARTPDSEGSSGRRTPQDEAGTHNVVSSPAQVHEALAARPAVAPRMDYAHMKPERYRDLAWATLAKSTSFFKREPSLKKLREELFAAGDLSASFMHQDSSVLRWTPSIAEDVLAEGDGEGGEAQLRRQLEAHSDTSEEGSYSRSRSGYAPPSLTQGTGGSSSAATADFVRGAPYGRAPSRGTAPSSRADEADAQQTPTGTDHSLFIWHRSEARPDREEPSGPVWASFAASQQAEAPGVVWGVRRPWYVAAAECAADVGGQLMRGLLMESWEEVREMGLLGKASLVLLLPFTLAQRATIPMIVDEAYSRPWLLVSIVLCPPWMAYYLGFAGAMSPAVWAATMVGALALAVLAGSHSQRDVSPEWNCGCRILIGAALMCTVGFAVAATWIAFVANELVAMLQFFGRLSGVSSAVLGLTVLAWGNSVGDLSTNIAMAKRGLSNMALTACFAGPLFNLLVGCGCGFALWLHDSGKAAVPVELSAPVVVGGMFILLNCVAIVTVGLLSGRRVPRQFGYFMMGIYALYVAVSLVMVIFL
eukprot:jgi/Tetstr1/458056/TSEL_044563.t1